LRKEKEAHEKLLKSMFNGDKSNAKI